MLNEHKQYKHQYVAIIQHIHPLHHVLFTLCFHYQVLFVVINDRHYGYYNNGIFVPSAP